METKTQILAINRNGNPHINLHGQFTPETAAELTSTIAHTFQGNENIFIYTAYGRQRFWPRPRSLKGSNLYS